MPESVRNQIKTVLPNGPWFHPASTPRPPAAGKTLRPSLPSKATNFDHRRSNQQPPADVSPVTTLTSPVSVKWSYRHA